MVVEQQKINRLAKKYKPYICPLCHKGEWVIGDRVFYLGEFNENAIVIGGQSFPVLPIVCSECGNTLFINAIVAGIVDVKKEEKTTKSGN